MSVILLGGSVYHTAGGYVCYTARWVCLLYCQVGLSIILLGGSVCYTDGWVCLSYC